MRVSYFSDGITAYTRIDDGRSTTSIRADSPSDSSYDVIRQHRDRAIKDLEWLQARLALYNSALSVLELENEQ